MEGIYDAIMAVKGKLVTLYLSSGLEFEGLVEDMSYFDKNDKNKKKPRMIILKQGDHTIYIDAIKVDAVKIYKKEAS